MDLQLTGKKALVTGGSSGIGFGIAKALLSEGVSVAVCARSGEKIAEASEELLEYSPTAGTDVLPVVADVSKPESIALLAKNVLERFGGIDILINNAGTGSEETIMDSDDEKWQYYWDLHVMAAVRLTRALVPSMRQRGGGVIINNASICAKQPLYYEPIYNTTKAALVMMTKCLANELIGDGIRVNTVNPGLVMTPDWRNTATILGKQEGITADEYLDRLAKNSAPIGRFASTEEIADFFIFLCSPRASYSVGSTYYVDGGWLNVVD